MMVFKKSGRFAVVIEFVEKFDALDKSCDICGDVGFTELLSICSQCNISHEHIYCRKIPWEGVMETWICEECHRVNKTTCLKPVHSEVSSDRTWGNMKNHGHTKVKYISLEEVIQMRSASYRKNSESKPPLGSNTATKMVCAYKKCFSFAAGGQLKAHGSKKMLLSSMKQNQMLSKGVDLYAPLVDIDGEKRESLDATLKFDRYLPNHPALYPTWKGSFRIHSDIAPDQFCDGLWAHPASKVHSKAYQFSKQMPEALHFRFLHRHKLWGDLFEDDVPDGLDIGLYFFSHAESSGASYTCLLEYLEIHDLFMRSSINGVELLIFTSKHLHGDSQKINERFFLWGFFRNLAPTKVALEVPYLENSEVDTEVNMLAGVDHSASTAYEAIDMDIDMLGGQSIGRTDIHVSQPKSKRLQEAEDSPRIFSILKSELVFECMLHNSFAKFSNFADGMHIPPGFSEADRLKIKKNTEGAEKSVI
ncbi:hypothetical protein Nepgr_018855 [Nepenthes gracilis]|uniref:AIPP2-like SPOC-like domain-containing protein n=1 Tax=Nepenthes gracilis TaxID=150966 RepID=A0AAD3SUL1_NEPGR|nr:hypothetical protein Nepgr_018855 [Nepenthes gracilis]